jgi:hypothetical protein
MVMNTSTYIHGIAEKFNGTYPGSGAGYLQQQQVSLPLARPVTRVKPVKVTMGFESKGNTALV